MMRGRRFYKGMQSIEHCIVFRTKLYAVMACCAVDNTHAERFCEAMAERVMIEANLWIGDSLSRANFRFGHCVNIGVQQTASQRQCCQQRPSLSLKVSANFLRQDSGAVYICNGGRRKVDRQGTSAGRIS